MPEEYFAHLRQESSADKQLENDVLDLDKKPIELTSASLKQILKTYVDPESDHAGHVEGMSTLSYSSVTLEYATIQTANGQVKLYVGKGNRDEFLSDINVHAHEGGILDVGNVTFSHSYYLGETKGQVREVFNITNPFSTYDILNRYGKIPHASSQYLSSEERVARSLEKILQIANVIPNLSPSFGMHWLQASQTIENQKVYDKLTQEIEEIRSRAPKPERFTGNQADAFVEYMLRSIGIRKSWLERLFNKQEQPHNGPTLSTEVRYSTNQEENGSYSMKISYKMLPLTFPSVLPAVFEEEYTIDPQDARYAHLGSAANIMILARLAMYETIDMRLRAFGRYFSRECEQAGITIPQERVFLQTQQYGPINAYVQIPDGKDSISPEGWQTLKQEIEQLGIGSFQQLAQPKEEAEFYFPQR